MRSIVFVQVFWICALFVAFTTEEEDCYVCTSKVEAAIEDIAGIIKTKEPMYLNGDKDDMDCRFDGLSTMKSKDEDVCPKTLADNVIQTTIKPVAEYFQTRCKFTMKVKLTDIQNQLVNEMNKQITGKFGFGKKDDGKKDDKGNPSAERDTDLMTLDKLMGFKKCANLKPPKADLKGGSLGGVAKPSASGEITVSGNIGAYWPKCLFKMVMEGRNGEKGANLSSVLLSDENIDNVKSDCDGDDFYVSMCECMIDAGFTQKLLYEAFREGFPGVVGTVMTEFKTLAESVCCVNMDGMRK